MKSSSPVLVPKSGRVPDARWTGKMQPVKKIIELVKNGLRTLSPTCRDASRLQSEALDGKLSFSKRLGLAMHLLICKWCRRYGKQVRFMRDAAREHPDNLSEAVPQKLSTEARERIKRRLQSES
jgi:hypothetical protein